MPHIRNASIADAKALAALAERTFRATFGAANTPEDIALHCATRYSADMQAKEIADPSMVTFVAEDGGPLIGFAQLRWRMKPLCVQTENAVELQRLYVDAGWHGKGVAHQLMNACMGEAANGNADAVWLGVWEKNPRAIAFYKKLGFFEVGEQVFELGRDAQGDVIMVRERRTSPYSN